MTVADMPRLQFNASPTSYGDKTSAGRRFRTWGGCIISVNRRSYGLPTTRVETIEHPAEIVEKCEHHFHEMVQRGHDG